MPTSARVKAMVVYMKGWKPKEGETVFLFLQLLLKKKDENYMNFLRKQILSFTISHTQFNDFDKNSKIRWNGFRFK